MSKSYLSEEHAKKVAKVNVCFTITAVAISIKPAFEVFREVNHLRKYAAIRLTRRTWYSVVYIQWCLHCVESVPVAVDFVRSF